MIAGRSLRRHEAEYLEFVSAASPGLHRLALGLARDWHRAQDLVQVTLEKVYVAWPRVRRAEDPFAYSRTVLLRQFVSEQRRAWRRRENVHATPPDPATGASFDDQSSARLDLLDLLGLLPPRQRAVMLLRYLEDLPVARVAELLGCGEGTVKSQTSSAAATLRRHLTAAEAAAPRILGGAQ